MTPDLGREAVYSAELAAFDGTAYEALTSFDDLLALARDVDRAGWWPHGEIEVMRARSDARSSSTRATSGRSPVVRLAADQFTPATLVHEFAHVLAGLEQGHGPVFIKAHVDLVRFAFGDDEASWLLSAYASIGLTPGIRSWSTAQRNRSSAIAL